MTANFAEAAHRLVVGQSGDGDSAKQVAERAEAACNKLARELARLIGETGVDMLLRRSIVQASTRFPWLVPEPSAVNVASMRSAMEHQPPEAIVEAFVAVITAFVALLERLIGEGLVDRIIAEVWTGVFTHEVKDTP